MNAYTPKLITLSCPSCGAKLDISTNLDRFACAFCGQEHIVNRTGGTISLSPVVEAIHQVKTGVDKTAAELAIVRINADISNLQTKKQQVTSNRPTSPNNNFQKISIIFGVPLIILSLFLFIGKNFFEGICILTLGSPFLVVGIFLALTFPKKVSSWEKVNKQYLIMINALDEQIAEKKVELEQNQRLVRK